MHKTEGEAEAIILVKASPQVGQKHGETVCCAGVTPEGEWLRLYPVTFRRLEDANKFKRWDRIRFRWRKPKDDARPESLRIDQESIDIIGELPQKEKQSLLARLEVTGLNAVAAQGKSLALLRPQPQPVFIVDAKTAEEIDEEKKNYESVCKQEDMFYPNTLKPLKPCPFRFKYRYKTDDGDREGTCQDWETNATFFNWRNHYGEEKALQDMKRVFGEEYPGKGMVFAMGTHSRYPDVWLINGIIRMDEVSQLSLI
jgi:hypothetical protein